MKKAQVSETRRACCMRSEEHTSVLQSPCNLVCRLLLEKKKAQLAPIRGFAYLIIDTSKFTVHELREFIGERFRGGRDESNIMIYVTSFGFRNGIPNDSDLVFDVRFLPNPNYIPRFKHLTG